MDDSCVGNKRKLLDLDPDYKDGHVVAQKRRCLDEETAQGESAAGVRTIWTTRLDAALDSKERETLRLQEAAHACRRALHLLRFGAAREYYAALTCPTAAAAAIPVVTGRGDASVSSPPVYSGLHPAVLKLLGNSVYGLPGLITRKTRRKIPAETTNDAVQESEKSLEEESQHLSQDLQTTDSSADNEVEEATRDEVYTKIPRYVPPIMPEPPTVCAASVRMERHRVKRRLVVGNISKWLPDDLRVDAASHKWMLYVRGPRDASDVSDIISKVRYFLHPSYRPHDIVDVVHPFYLTRRGWGEFPVRVQVHFCLPGNRPIDIIHNLKLDRTYSGLQTLGSETVVDVWLKTPQSDEVAHLLGGERKVEEDVQYVPEPGTVLFSDGKHETLVHKTSEKIPQTSQFRKVIKLEPADDQGEDSIHDSQNNVKNVPYGEIKIKEEDESEVSENVESFSHHACDSTAKISLPSVLRRRVFHDIPDHDYLGNCLYKIECKTCSQLDSDIDPKENSNILATVKQETPQETRLNGTRETDVLVNLDVPTSKLSNLSGKSNAYEIKNDGIYLDTSEKKNGIVNNTAFVQCVDEQGNIFVIGLERPPLSANCISRKDGESAGSSVLELPPIPFGSFDVSHSLSASSAYLKGFTRRNGFNLNSITIPTSGRSLLKKNYVSGTASSRFAPDVYSSTTSTLAATPKIFLNCENTEALKICEVSLIEDVLKEARIILPKLEERAAAIWVLRQLSLIDPRAQPDSDFAHRNPFCAHDKQTFLNWTLGKRLCAERLRAKAAQEILQVAGNKRFSHWSVRHLLVWARLHGLVPSVLLPSRQRPPPEEHTLLPSSTLSEPTDVRDWLERTAEVSRAVEEGWTVDVESESVPACGVKDVVREEEFAVVLPMGVDVQNGECEFLQRTVRQLGFQLDGEPLYPGVLYPSAECVMLSAVRSLCEDLLRRSLHRMSSHCDKATEITLHDVLQALLTRSEFDIFSNAGLGVLAFSE